MTVVHQTNRVEYTATAGQTVFAFAFPVWASGDLQVYKNASLLTYPSHYTLTGLGSLSGGTVVLVTAASAGDTLILRRQMPYDQTTDYVDSDAFTAAAAETALDKQTMLSQQLKEISDRCLQLNVAKSHGKTGLELPVPTGNPDSGATSWVARWNALHSNLEVMALTTQTGLVSDIIASSTEAALPAAGTPGKLRRLTDVERGLVYDNGARFIHVGTTHLDLKEVATAGLGTAGSPFTGWEAAVSALPADSRVYIPGRMRFRQTAQVTMKAGWIVEGDGPNRSRIDLLGAIKGWVYEPGSLTQAGITLRDFALVGELAATADLISLKNLVGTRLSGLWLRDTADSGVKVDTCYNTTIEQCRIEEYTDNGVYLNACNLVNLLDVDFELNAITGTNALRGTNSGWVNVIGCNFEGTTVGVRGLLLEGAAYWTLLGNFFEFYTDSDIRAQTSLSKRINIWQTHVQSANAVKVDFNVGGLAHRAISVRGLRVIGGAGHYGFSPGSTVDFEYLFGEADAGGTHVFGYGEANVLLLGSSTRLQTGYHANVVGISSSATRANNLTGDVTITDPATTAAVNFGTVEADTAYQIVCTVSDITGTPAAGIVARAKSRTTGGFTIELSAAPGGAGANAVRVSWMLLR